MKADPSPQPPPAPPPLWRDPWAWASLLAVVPLVVHSLGAPLGEPVADDFDCLHRVHFTPGLPLFEGYGSASYWRPLSRQIYFKLLAPLILPQPALIAALHTALLALTSLLLYRVLRARLGGLVAALAASFPLLMESSRMLIAWPSNFQDLGAMLFMALAVHEAAAARLATTIAALLGALFCKELAAPVALLLPWLPAVGRRNRARWSLWIAATLVAWGITYALVQRSAGLVWPKPALLAGVPEASLPARYAWACVNAARAAMSLPVDSSAFDALAGGVVVLLALAIGIGSRSPAARARRDRAMLWMGGGLAWFAASTLTLAPTYPDWLAYRGAFPAIGLGVAVTALLGAAHPGLAGALLALRLLLFALSPGPPDRVTTLAEERGAALDFPKLARLERVVHDTRATLFAGFPTLPSGARVGLYNLPWMAEYAFGGNQALQVWYRDSTLRWVRPSELLAHPETRLDAVAELETSGDPPVVLIEPQALRALNAALEKGGRSEWAAAYLALDRADSLMPGVAARAFAGQVAGVRAFGLAYDLERFDDAEREARRSILLIPGNPYGHTALGLVAFARGRLAEAEAETDSALLALPNYPPALKLRDVVRSAAQQR